MTVRRGFFYSILCLFLTQVVEASSCTYETWDWDVNQRKAVNHQQVRKSKAVLTPEEKGSLPGCTVCEEDQIDIQIQGVPPFKICKILQIQLNRALQKVVQEGFPLFSIVGYRVGKSKGPLDSLGRRTQFSNHSYGTAIDFNSERNGLYDACIHFGPQCRLIRGGDYQVGRPGTITRDSGLYRALKVEGFKWGGEIQAKQKDFMHFSQTGM